MQPGATPHSGASDPGRGGGRSGVPLLSSGRGGKTEIISGTGRMIGSGKTRSMDLNADGGDGVTLNLVNVPIAQAAKIVLGDIAGVDYVVDPKLDGKVTIHTAKPVRKTAAYELFESALRVSGAAIVDSSGVYKIVPADQAATAGGPIAAGPAGPASSQQIGEGARVVQLRYVSASEMKRVLDPIAARGGVVRADDARNTLTLTGSAQEISALQDAISMFDVDTMRGMSFALTPVRSSDPDALTEDLRNVFGSEKEGPMAGMIRFIGSKRLSAILVITSQPQYLSRARAWIERLDSRAAGSEKQFYSYRVQNRPARELLQVISSMFGGDTSKGNNVSSRNGQSSASSGGAFGATNVSSTAPLGSLGPTSSGAGGGGFNSSPGGGMGGGGLGSSQIGGQGGGAGGLGSGGLGSGGLGSGGPGGSGAAGGGIFGAAGGGAGGQQNGQGGTPTVSLGEDSRWKLAVDDAKNALVIMATPDDYKRIARVIETLDVLPNQVYIEATIAEVSLNDQLNFGVRWFFNKNASTTAFSGGQRGTPQATQDTLGNNLLGADLGAIFPGFNYALRAGNAMATLHALNAITNVNIISTPSLTVLDNRQAMLQIGDQVPVTTLSGANATAGVTTFNSVNYRDTGVILAITPHINESGRVMLELEQQVSNVAPGTPADSTTPTIQQRMVKTQVIVNDSESLILGGLMQDSHSRGSNQTPVAGDVPIVGNLFKDKSDTANKQELIIMITPHVIRSLNEAREVTDEFKRKLLQISAKAKTRPHDIEQSARRVLLDEWSIGPSPADKYSR
jgi:general secretion pathway protein D